MQFEDLILFGKDRDEVVQIVNRKKYVELRNSQTELTTSLLIIPYVHVPKKNKGQRPWLYK